MAKVLVATVYDERGQVEGEYCGVEPPQVGPNGELVIHYITDGQHWIHASGYWSRVFCALVDE